MSPVCLVVWLATVAGAAMLLLAAVEHARDRAWLRAVLAAQKVLPVPVRALVVRWLAPCETVIGLAVLSGLLTNLPHLLRAALLAQAVLYLGFTGHTLLVRHRSPGAPCGCSTGSEPAGWPVVLRALLVCLASIGALWLPAPVGLAWAASTTMAGILLGIVGWTFPRFTRQ